MAVAAATAAFADLEAKVVSAAAAGREGGRPRSGTVRVSAASAAAVAGGGGAAAAALPPFSVEPSHSMGRGIGGVRSTAGA